MSVVSRPLTLASLQCPDGARRVFTYQADVACTKREARWGVRRVAWGVNYVLPRTVREADFSTLCILSSKWMRERVAVLICLGWTVVLTLPRNTFSSERPAALQVHPDVHFRQKLK